MERHKQDTKPEKVKLLFKNLDWISLAWELPNKDKKRAPEKVLKPKKDFESI